ncbi:MAG: hypothetical protein HOF23_09495 [Rhodospirillaceae bacterium]|nr:hypothetical protein [Rhodospirillaceae bacterium]
MTDNKSIPVDDIDHINILMLTRGRPEKVVRAISSLDNHADKKDHIDLWIYVDDDDSKTHELIASGWDKSIGIPVHWHVDSRPITHGDAFTKLWQNSSNAGLYFGFPDDYELMTPGWDIIMLEWYHNLPTDRLAIGYLPDPFMPEGGITTMVVTAQWINLVGHFIVPHFPYWFGDKWLQQIAEMVDRKYCVPIKLFPMDGKKGTTHRLWDLPFWTRFFHLLLAERVETAKQLIGYLNGDNTLAQSQAIEFMNGKVEDFQQEADDELSPDQLHVHQLAFSGESEIKDETYLAALRQAEAHLEKMTPQIIKLKTQQVLRQQQKLLAQSMEQ